MFSPLAALCRHDIDHSSGLETQVKSERNEGWAVRFAARSGKMATCDSK